MFVQYLATPLGTLTLRADDLGLTAVSFQPESDTAAHPNAVTSQAAAELTAYFAGCATEFSVPLHPQGTEFQRNVWHQLSLIPFGETRAYGDIAHALANPKAVRAVGAANGRNPIAIIVPCHRVIGGNGTLTGYAGGLERKAWLLNHEGITFKTNDGRRAGANPQLPLFD